ncbi:aminotransferase class I/II-fold pyridoxal phosphate-dependent enzyme, partial [Streptomyces sp. TRM76130]|nr:aminotransferase class I/II-fold pyridoxal phosphate-dependent enzyme [Streptomyces sp. TRM76130]
VVLRSLTKTWGLAGLRIGYVLAAPDVIGALERAQPLWPVSTPALAAAEACVGPRALAEAAHAAHHVAADRDRLVAGLRE